MVAEIGVDELTAVVDEVFGLMAGMQLVPSASLIAANQEQGYLVSAVQMVGDWQGAVRLDIDLELARQACANLTGVEPASLTVEDIRDAAGELANITGGSVKALCAPTSKLSLPTVVIGKHFEFSMAQGKVIRALSLTHDSGAMTISVIERDVP